MKHEVDPFIQHLKSKKIFDIQDGPKGLIHAYSNVEGFERKFPGILKIESVEQLRCLVAEANQHERALYPYSKGYNWGYGSHQPVQDNSLLVDLSALNEIFKIDEENGLAHIGPGVTQSQLAAELQRLNSHYFVDVTGSGASTSILGNALERGICYNGLRVHQVMGLEVMLADGSTLKTGFGDYPKPLLEGLYPYGLGPSLEGLFFQSNMGIVYRGIIKLKLRPESVYTLNLAVKSKNLNDLVEELKVLRRLGLIDGIPHLANRERTLSTVLPLIQEQECSLSTDQIFEMMSLVIKGDWNLTLSMSGTRNLAKAKFKEVKKKLKRLGTISRRPVKASCLAERLRNLMISIFANRAQKIVLRATEDLVGLHFGCPSNAGIKFLIEDEKRVDQSANGFLLCTPLAPLCGKSAEYFHEAILNFAKRFDIKIAMTLNLITDQILEAVISVHFDRNSTNERDRAHSCVKAMSATFNKRGFYPYRINIDQMKDFADPNNNSHKVLAKIKQCIDPKAIISPGRYEFEQR